MHWIRPALPADRAALATLYRDCLRAADWLPPGVAARADFERDTAGELVLVEWQAAADAAPLPTGFVSAWVPTGFIHHLYVAGPMRGRGSGTRLLAALGGRMALPWQLKCVQDNEAARRFYARRGWQQVAVEDDGEDGVYVLLEQRNSPG